jgi:hypothetical protein
MIAVRHPHGELVAGGHGPEHARVITGLAHAHGGAAVFALVGGADHAAEQVRRELRAVADAEDGNAQVVELRVDRRCAFVVDARRASRKHDARGLHRAKLCELRVVGERVRMDLAVDGLLADPARDQLRVLRSEIEDENQLMCGHRAFTPFGSSGLPS